MLSGRLQLLTLPAELREGIARRLHWRTALRLALTCRTLHSTLLPRETGSLWRHYYHCTFPPCDREGKLFLWLVAQQRGCSVSEVMILPPNRIHWFELFQRRFQLEENWRHGRSARYTVSLPLAEGATITEHWHTHVLAVSSAGSLLYRAGNVPGALFLVENRPQPRPVQLSFSLLGEGHRLAPFSLVDKAHYVHMNDLYIVVVAMLMNPDEDYLCVWRWEDVRRQSDALPAGDALSLADVPRVPMHCHWRLRTGHDSIIVDLFGRWLLWMEDGKDAHHDPLATYMQLVSMDADTPTVEAATDDDTGKRPFDHFYVHNLAQSSGQLPTPPVLTLKARSGCVHIQPSRQCGTGCVNDAQISVFLVDAELPGLVTWEQWMLDATTDRPPTRLRSGQIATPMPGGIDYLWTMRMAESNDDEIYTLVVHPAAKWEMVISTRDESVRWVRQSADAPGNLVMGHGLLMIDAYEPEELSLKALPAPPPTLPAPSTVISSSLNMSFDTAADMDTIALAQAAVDFHLQQGTVMTLQDDEADIDHPPHLPLPDAMQLLQSLNHLHHPHFTPWLPGAPNTHNDHEADEEEEEEEDEDEAAAVAQVPSSDDVPLIVEASHSSAQGTQRTVILDMRTGETLHRYATLGERSTLVVAGAIVLVSHRTAQSQHAFLLDVESGDFVRYLDRDEYRHGRQIHASTTHIPVFSAPNRVVLHDYAPRPPNRYSH